MKDYYEVLGVSKNVSPDEIKAAYRKQALKWHPDRNKSEEATQRFKEVNKAFEVLSDPKKKELYDQYGHEAFERSGAGGAARQGPFTYTYSNYGQGSPFEGFDFGGFSDPFEIFEQFFGFRSPFSGQRRQARRSVYEIALDFNEAVKGTTKKVNLGKKTKTIKIPAGVDNGMRIRFSDFDLIVSVRPDKTFKREGQDIYLEKEISFPQAVLGAVVEVPTLEKLVQLKVRPGTQSGTTVRLRGQGVAYPNTNQHGDEYIIFKIKVPENLSSKAKNLLEELKNEL